MNKALLYVRVSSKEQEKEGFSLDAQEKLGLDYADRNDLKVVKSWKGSESAWKKDRLAFNAMIDYAKRHDDIRHIIFDITDRMTRNDFDKLKIYELIKDYGKTIHFSRSNKILDRAATPEDLFMLDIEVAVAKKMSNDISRKTRMGMLEKAEQGLYPSVAPLGYVNNRLTHLIDVDESKAPFIRRMFELMASGQYSLLMIANTLHKEGFRNKKGGKCGKSCIAHLLNNPVYYGVFRWQEKLYEGGHTPIITKELFDSAQAVMKGKSRVHIQDKFFAFNNLILCGTCGCKVIGEKKKKKYNYYHCTFSKGRHESRPYIREEKLSELFEDSVKAITIDREIADWLKDALKERAKSSVKLQENRLNAIKTQYDRVNNRLSRLFDAKFDNEISESAFVTKEKEYRTELLELKTQMDGMNRTNPNFYEDGCQVLELCNRMHSLYVKANYEEKAKMLGLLASNYTLDDVNIVPTYRKPFSFFNEKGSRLEWLPELVRNENL